MTLSEVELKLAEFDIGFPRELAIEPIRDGIDAGYKQFLEKQNHYEKLRESDLSKFLGRRSRKLGNTTFTWGVVQRKAKGLVF